MGNPRIWWARCRNTSRLRASRSVCVATARTWRCWKPASRSAKSARHAQPRSIASAGIAALAFAVSAYAQDVTGGGSRLVALEMARWVVDSDKATGDKIIYGSVGSGAGIRQNDVKTVACGANDMPLKDDDLAKN